MPDAVDFGYNDDDEAGAPMLGRPLAVQIAADIAARKRRVKEIVHPDVPKWRAVYRLPNDRMELAPLQVRAEKAEKRKQPYFFDAAVLATLNESLTYLGQSPDPDGPATFRDTVVLDMLGAANASEAVRIVYGSDGIVSAVAQQLMNAAGYGTADEVQVDDVEDPSNAG
jgi:hypothetical protein